jgi:protein phosphatase inhibitor 2
MADASASTAAPSEVLPAVVGAGGGGGGDGSTAGVRLPAGNGGETDGAPPDAKKKRRPKIKWDEEVIKEHDKLRGTRGKIDEPDTPFNHDFVDSDDDKEQQGTSAASGGGGGGGAAAHRASPPPGAKSASLEANIGGLEAALAENPKSKWEDDALHSPDQQKRIAHEAFSKKRSQHYNMGEQLRLAKLANERELAAERAAQEAAEIAAQQRQPGSLP